MGFETLAEMDVNAPIAAGRWPHGQLPLPAPRDRIPANATTSERMTRKTRTKKGHSDYARRKVIVELRSPRATASASASASASALALALAYVSEWVSGQSDGPWTALAAGHLAR